MRLTQCICSRCSCAFECEYYEEVVKPIIDAVTKFILNDDLFTVRIKDALESFECDYFE